MLHGEVTQILATFWRCFDYVQVCFGVFNSFLASGKAHLLIVGLIRPLTFLVSIPLSLLCLVSWGQHTHVHYVNAVSPQADL